MKLLSEMSHSKFSTDSILDKCSVCLIYADEIISLWSRYKETNTEFYRAKLEKKLNTLLEYLLETFDGTVPNSEFLEIWNSDNKSLSIDNLNKMTQAAVPIAVMRYILNGHRIYFDPRQVPKWRVFSSLYGKFILRS